MYLLKYFLMRGDTFIVPSLALTSEAGSKHVRPDGPADFESRSESNLSCFIGSWLSCLGGWGGNSLF